jgi:hypothetical protein
LLEILYRQQCASEEIIFTPLSSANAIQIKNPHRLAKVLVASLMQPCLLEAKSVQGP